MKNTFDADLKVGKIGEETILTLIHKKYPKAYLGTGYQPKYDIFIPEKDFGIEVKTDRMSRKTGNVAIECEYKGMPSGIHTTKSKYWIIIFWDKTWKYGIIKTDVLLELCKRSSPIPAGQGAKVHLIPKDLFMVASRTVQNVTGNAS